MLTTEYLGGGVQAVCNRLVRKIAVLEKAACNAGAAGTTLSSCASHRATQGLPLTWSASAASSSSEAR
jgi:hypothetical protein